MLLLLLKKICLCLNLSFSRCYAQIGGITLEDLNQMEAAFVKSLSFKLEVARNEYESCRQALHIAALGGEVMISFSLFLGC